MSRTYRKILRLNNCTGSNTEYYRMKRRVYRRISKTNLHINPDEYVNPEELSHFKDYWREPTDGSYLVDRKDVTKLFKGSRWYKKLIVKLKPKKSDEENGG